MKFISVIILSMFICSCITLDKKNPQCTDVIGDFYKATPKSDIIFATSYLPEGVVFRTLNEKTGMIRALCLITPIARANGFRCFGESKVKTECEMTEETGAFYEEVLFHINAAENLPAPKVKPKGPII